MTAALQNFQQSFHCALVFKGSIYKLAIYRHITEIFEFCHKIVHFEYEADFLSFFSIFSLMFYMNFRNIYR